MISNFFFGWKLVFEILYIIYVYSDTGDCVLSPKACGICKNGQYLCPDMSTCIQGAENFGNNKNTKIKSNKIENKYFSL